MRYILTSYWDLMIMEFFSKFMFILWGVTLVACGLDMIVNGFRKIRKRSSPP